MPGWACVAEGLPATCEGASMMGDSAQLRSCTGCVEMFNKNAVNRNALKCLTKTRVTEMR
eukprot:scaffold60573_cov18-Tisochrysis_lutea.AAC.3